MHSPQCFPVGRFGERIYIFFTVLLNAQGAKRVPPNRCLRSAVIRTFRFTGSLSAQRIDTRNILFSNWECDGELCATAYTRALGLDGSLVKFDYVIGYRKA